MSEDRIVDPEERLVEVLRLTAGRYEAAGWMRNEDVLRSPGLPDLALSLAAVVGDGPTYISFDVDGLDPAYAPGTGTPEIGGLTTREAQALIRGLRGLNLVGGDVVEVAPQYDPTTNTARAGAQMMFEILCLLAEARAAGD